MKIIKPKTLGLISRTYSYKDNLFTVGGLGFFRLGGDENFLPDADCWKQIAPVLNGGLSEQLVLDMGFAKPRGEWLLAGSAHTEKGKPVTELLVTAKLGNSCKRIQVVGDRLWNGRRLSLTSQVRPFTSMPLCYSRAYGGVGNPYNPVGRGVINKANKRQATGDYALPNLYLANEKTSADKKPRSVACFGPVDINLPQRTQYHGRYNQKWLENVHPGFPHDTDPRYFNAAPEDQQFTNDIKPGTEYELTAMHPDQPCIRGRLPLMNIRAFVTQRSPDDSGDDQFIEIDTKIDTVWFFPELLLGVAIYRGQLAVRDCDGLDINALMLAYERLADEPRTVDHYKELMLLRCDKKTAGIHALNEAPLTPKKSPSEQLQIATLYHQAKVEHKRKRERFLEQQVVKNTFTEQQKQQSLLDDSTDLEPIPQLLIDSSDIDFAKYLDQLDRLVETEISDAHVKLAAINQQQTDRKKPPAESQECLHQRVFNPVYTSADRVNAPHVKTNMPPSKERAAIAQRQTRQTATSCTDMTLPLDEDNTQLVRSWVLALMQQDVSLSGRDFAGANLSGFDFSDQDLTDVMFEKADLTGCTFINCRLQGAVFTQATLNNAIFDSADAQQVNWSKVHASEVSFKQANLTGAQLNATTLVNCDFTSANLNNIKAIETDFSHSCMKHISCHKGQFMNATLEDTLWQGAIISFGNFVRCNMRRSVWDYSSLKRTIMVDTKAELARFCHVTATKVQFSNLGNFTGADFSNGHWHSCGFRSIDLTHSVIHASLFEACDFGETNLREANLTSTMFKGSIMKQADLSHSICRDTLFVLSSLKKSKFDRADISTAKFQSSDLNKTQFLQCQPSKSNIEPVASLS